MNVVFQRYSAWTEYLASRRSRGNLPIRRQGERCGARVSQVGIANSNHCARAAADANPANMRKGRPPVRRRAVTYTCSEGVRRPSARWRSRDRVHDVGAALVQAAVCRRFVSLASWRSWCAGQRRWRSRLHSGRDYACEPMRAGQSHAAAA